MTVQSLERIYIPFDGHILYVGDIMRNTLSDIETEGGSIFFQPVMCHQEGLCRLRCVSFYPTGENTRIIRYLIECMGEITELQINSRIFVNDPVPYSHDMDWFISSVELPAMQIPVPRFCESEPVPVSITVDGFGELGVGMRWKTTDGNDVFIPNLFVGTDSIKFYQLEAFATCQDFYFLTGLWTDSYTDRLLKVRIGPDFCPQVKVYTSHIAGDRVTWESVR